MKKTLVLLLFLFLITITQAQDKFSLNNGEITIPLGKKIILKSEQKNNKITTFELIQEQNITDKLDIFKMLKDFKKDDKKDNTIEFTFSEAEMMKSPIFVLMTLQKIGKKMSFKAKIRLKGASKYISTSIMPALNNVNSVEQWRDNIDSIILYDFELEN